MQTDTTKMTAAGPGRLHCPHGDDAGVGSCPSRSWPLGSMEGRRQLWAGARQGQWPGEGRPILESIFVHQASGHDIITA